MSEQNQPSAPISTLWCHRKTGGIYVICGECQIEATNEVGILYSSVQIDGPMWCRPKAEFLDGRFVQLDVS